VLDHSGAVWRHGLPEDHVEWTLDPGRRAESKEHTLRCESRATSLLECTSCGAVRVGGKPCEACGFMPRRPAEYVRIQDGELGLVTGRNAKVPVYDRETKRRWYGEFTAITREMGKNPGWPFHLYQAKFGEKPSWDWRGVENPPTPEVRSYVRSRQIAFRKSRTAAATAAHVSGLPSSAVPVGGYWQSNSSEDAPW
jgi:hypothetical protein